MGCGASAVNNGYPVLAYITAAGVTGPATLAKGAEPLTIADLTANHSTYTVTSLSWQNSDGSPSTLADGKFQGEWIYKAEIVLTSVAGHKFLSTDLTPVKYAGISQAGTVSGGDISGNTLTFTVTFPVTGKIVTGIAVKTQPSDLNYTKGEALDLSGLEATLTYTDSSTSDVAWADFGANAIAVSPPSGTVMSVADHNGNPVTLTCDSQSATPMT